MNKEEYYELSPHEQNLVDRELTQKEYEVLPDYERKLVDTGLPTLAETKGYRKTVEWVPYDEYMKTIFHHCPGRKHDEFNMEQDWFDSQLAPDKLLREAAYLLSLKHRPCHSADSEWTQEDQLDLEETLYNRFKSFAAEWEVYGA
jgi:hypothetical protein